MELNEDIPSRVLINFPHIIKAFCRYLHSTLHSLQAFIKEFIAPNLVPDFLLQLLSVLGHTLYSRKLRACWLAGMTVVLGIFAT